MATNTLSIPQPPLTHHRPSALICCTPTLSTPPSFSRHALHLLQGRHPPPSFQHFCPPLPPPPNSPQPQAPSLALLPWRRSPPPSPFTSLFHNYVSTLVARANILAVSVDYGPPPEHPIPVAYEHSWAALHWVASHRTNPGPEPWLNEHADFTRVFLGGDSFGANVVHNVAMAAGNPENELDLEILGAALVHPFFWGSHPIGSEAVDQERKASIDRLWPHVRPSTADQDDPRVNPVAEGSPSLAWLGCGRVLVCVAERDILRERGWLYYNALSQSGWLGVVEIHETQEEDHCFHLHDMGRNEAQDLLQCLADFFNRDAPPLI